MLKKVINNINQNKSSKLKAKSEEINKVNKEIDTSIELFEDGILTKNELADRVKKRNEEIETLKFRVDELQQEVMLAEGGPIPFELVSKVMKKYSRKVVKDNKESTC